MRINKKILLDFTKLTSEEESTLRHKMYEDSITQNMLDAEREFIEQLEIKRGIKVSLHNVWWGSNAKNMSKQQLIDYLWKVENAPKRDVLPGQL